MNAEPKWFVKSAVTLAAVAVAVGMRWLLDPLMGSTLPVATIFGAVAVAVWLGGTARRSL